MSNNALLRTTTASVWLAMAALAPAPLSAQDAATAAVDTSAAVEAAGWADNVVITLDADDNTFRYQSNGIPSHGFAKKYLIPSDPTNQPFKDKPAEFFKVVTSAEYFKETELDTTITTRPVFVDETTETSLGRIGVALSGAQLFNDYEDMERAVVA